MSLRGKHRTREAAAWALRRPRVLTHDRRHPAHDANGFEYQRVNFASFNIVVR